MAKTNMSQGHTGALVNLRKNMDAMFEHFARPWPSADHPWFGRQSDDSTWSDAFPSVDVMEKKKELVIKAELPGLKEEDVNVEVADNLITLRGEKTAERTEEDDAFYLSERRYGSFRRSFMLPDNIKTDKISAKFRNGVLTVRLPKNTQAQQRNRRIEIKSN